MSTNSITTFFSYIIDNVIKNINKSLSTCNTIVNQNKLNAILYILSLIVPAIKLTGIPIRVSSSIY